MADGFIPGDPERSRFRFIHLAAIHAANIQHAAITGAPPRGIDPKRYVRWKTAKAAIVAMDEVRRGLVDWTGPGR